MPYGIYKHDNAGEKHGMWKGDKVKYRALHNWVDKNLGKPNFCEHCKKTDKKK